MFCTAMPYKTRTFNENLHIPTAESIAMKLAAVFLLVALSCSFETQASTVSGNCLASLLENGAPSLILKLGNLLCKYQQAKETQNQSLFVAFIGELKVVLAEVGCSMDDLLGKHVETTIDNVVVIADKVALVLFDIMNGLPVTTKFMRVACGTLENLLSKVKSILETVKKTLDNVVVNITLMLYILYLNDTFSTMWLPVFMCLLCFVPSLPLE
uniref:Uncharacterized protein n=1 Tax=Xenopus tropicalis TaxID=8364 RepID=A0A803KFR2_XENTR